MDSDGQPPNRPTGDPGTTVEPCRGLGGDPRRRGERGRREGTLGATMQICPPIRPRCWRSSSRSGTPSAGAPSPAGRCSSRRGEWHGLPATWCSTRALPNNTACLEVGRSPCSGCCWSRRWSSPACTSDAGQPASWALRPAVGAMYGWSWAVSFAVGFLILSGVARMGASEEVMQILANSLSCLVVAALYMAGGALWRDRGMFVVGVWILRPGPPDVAPPSTYRSWPWPGAALSAGRCGRVTCPTAGASPGRSGRRTGGAGERCRSSTR